MQDFLTSVVHLTETQRSALRRQDLDSPESIIAFTPEVLANAASLTLGSAGKLHVAATRAMSSTPDADYAYRAKMAAVRAALEAVAQDPQQHRVRAAEALRVHHVVLPVSLDPNEGPKLHVDMTMALLADLEHGAPVPRVWQGHRVTPITDLVTPSVLWHPRTGKPLQAGKDEFGIAWADLGIDVLRLLTYGYSIDAFHGMTDAAVFEQGKLGTAEMPPMIGKLKSCAAAEGVDLSKIHLGREWRRDSSQIEPSRHDFERSPPRAVPTTGSPASRLARLFLNMFSADELRRFIRYMPNGREIDGLMPGTGVSLMQVATDAADLLHRHGLINRDLRDRLVVERPRRAAEIDAFFNSVL